MKAMEKIFDGVDAEPIFENIIYNQQSFDKEKLV